MKKIIILLLLCVVLAAFPVSASNNVQKIHSVNSDVYQAITSLYIQSGYALPSTAGPWSSDELIKMLDRVDYSSLAQGGQYTYDYVLSQLYEESKLYEFGLDAALETYLHTNTTHFTKPTNWIRGFDDRKPFLDITLETWPSKHFYGFTSLSIMQTKFSDFVDNTSNAIKSKFFGEHILTTNLFFIPPGVIGDLDLGMPYRAFGSFGGDGWSVEVGRDKLSWGAGVTGNFMLSDHLKYHNQGRFTTYGKNFKYTFATSFFPHPKDYYPTDTDEFNQDQRSQGWVIDGLNMFIGHRVEWRMFYDKVGLALSESIMYQSRNNLIDLRVLSPTTILHNYYIRSNSNSLLTLEVDYSPIKYLNVYGQIAVDEMALPGEPVPGKDDSAFPSAFGYMLGVKSSYPVNKGVVYGSFEWALTDPFLYLRYGEDLEKQKQGIPGINYVVAIREYLDGGRIGYDEQFLGYPFGGDAIVFNLQGGYKHFGKWSAEANLFYMMHGTYDQWTGWVEVNNKNIADGESIPYDSTPTQTHHPENHLDDDAFLNRDAVSHTIALGIKGDYTILSTLNVYGQMDFISIIHPGNSSSRKPIYDIQLTLGVSYSL